MEPSNTYEYGYEMDSSDEEELIVLHQRREFQPLYTRAVLMRDERGHRRYINRDRAGSHDRIWNDYFIDNCKYPSEYFRRRFRMRCKLFMRILSDVETHDVYFTQPAIRLLSYGYSADCCDEYLQIGETMVVESMKHFCDIVIVLYESQYMRAQNTEGVARLLHEGDARGFPRMLGSLDCMHWEWKNCPTVWYGIHRVNYEVNGHQYTMGYFLTDGIYPRWVILIQSISHSISGKERLFAMKHEATRKDVERAFGVLQSRWAITHGPARFWKKNDFCKIMKTCIILHNIIIKDERQTNLEPWVPLQEENVELPSYARDPALLGAHIASRMGRIRNRGINNTLRSDLLEHVWRNYGNEP
ncbi:hypothetical protein ACOSP7_013963 [Xanthoceras sorbifolium]